MTESRSASAELAYAARGLGAAFWMAVTPFCEWVLDRLTPVAKWLGL